MSAPLPLFHAREIKEIEDLWARRAKLEERIEALPPTSHKCIALRDRLQRLTHRAMQAERDLAQKEADI